MHLGMPECHKPFLGHCEYDLWPSFQESLCPEHISYSIWCRNPKFGVVIPLGMVEWCIPFWVTLTLTLTSGLISRFFVLYYSLLSSNVSYARPIPLGAFVTCLWHFLFISGRYSNPFSVILSNVWGFIPSSPIIGCLDSYCPVMHGRFYMKRNRLHLQVLSPVIKLMPLASANNLQVFAPLLTLHVIWVTTR